MTTPSEPYTEWHHALNCAEFSRGDVFGWSDSRSPTGLASGIIVEIDYNALRVKVGDIRAAVMK